MKKTISSKWTFFVKFILLPLLIVPWGMFVLGWLIVEAGIEHCLLSALWLVVSIVIWSMYGSIKIVHIEDDHLIVSNYLETACIPLSEIGEVNDCCPGTIPRITIRFRNMTAFDWQICFIPVGGWSFFRTHPMVNELKKSAGL